MPVPGLRANSIDHGVYRLIKQLEQQNNDGKAFRSITHAYDAVKRSNSPLSRQKKAPLMDAIDRALQVRKRETHDDSSDSEAALEEADEQLSKLEDEKFNLNMQMTKHWNTTTTSSSMPAAKKRRINPDDDDNTKKAAQSPAENANADAQAPPRANGSLEDKSDPKATGSKTPPVLKKRPARYKVEHAPDVIRLGGLDQIQHDLLLQLRSMLRGAHIWGPLEWERIPGILISGPAGVGKTSLVRATASQLEVPILSVGECFDNQERMEKSFADAVDEAMRLAPCIMLFDDLDYYASKSDSAKCGDHESQIIKLFKREVERMQRESPSDRPVVLMATTSNITYVHPEMTKSGWFEQTIPIKVPDAKAREGIFTALLPKPATLQDVDVDRLVKCTNGYVGADIKQLIRGAEQRAATRIIQAEDQNQNLLSQGDEAMAGTEEEDGTQPAAAAAAENRVVTMKDFLLTIEGFTPSLRKEGFTQIPNVSWDQVGALEEARKELTTSIIGPIKEREAYLEWGLGKPSGVILHGPPGCGKTLIAQAVANEAQASFILINGPELLNKYVGESERGVRELFARARLSAPCILFFDEIDSLAGRRQGGSSEAGVRVVNTLLTELDGAQGREGVYVIGATNRFEMLDEAIVRPGRLNRRVYVGLPDAEERVDILETIVRSNRPQTTQAEIDLLAQVARDDRCAGFSGANLFALFVKAGELAMGRSRVDNVKRLTEDDWERALSADTLGEENR